MSDSFDSANATLLETGVVKFPPNIHGIYVEREATGHVLVTLQRNDSRLSLLLDAAACRHLATLLLRGVDG